MNYSEELVKKTMKLTAISVIYQTFYKIGDVAVYNVFVHVYLHYIENVITYANKYLISSARYGKVTPS